MVSITELIFVFLIFECGFIISSGSPLTTENSSISLFELVEELRQEPSDVRLLHLSFMFLVESVGDRVYDVSKNPTAECSTAIRANTLMFEKLAISKEVNEATTNALKVITQDLESNQTMEEHPLELFCKRITKKYSENATLRVAFEKAKDEAAKFKGSSRPTYSQGLLKFNSTDSLRSEMVYTFIVPELARIMAVASFVMASQLESPNSTYGFSPRRHFFARSCVAVAAEDQFADSMQSAFIKAMNDTILEISVEDRLEKYKAAADGGGFWWIAKMMKTLYSYVESDLSLKAEIESKAASFSADASQEDLDFSKL